MKNQYIYIKNIFVVLILSIFPMTSVYAEKDLNSLLNGVYAQNEAWACVSNGNSYDPGDPDEPRPPSCPGGANCATVQIIAAGEITYYGDGTANGTGVVGSINHTDPGGGNISTYDCDWTYTVEDKSNFSYEGECDVLPVGGGPLPLAIVTNQKWVGHIGKDKETITVERLDGEVEGIDIDDGTNAVFTIVEQICSKTGVQIKLKDDN